MNVASISWNASGCGLLNSYAIARVGLTMMQPGRFYQRLLQQQLLAASIVVLGLAGAHAQDNDNITTLPPVNVAPAEQPPPLNVAPADQPPPQVLPPSPRSSGPASQNASRSTTPCKGDGSAADKGFGCLNQKLKNQVDEANSNAATPTAPLDAKSSDLKVGVVNVPGVQQQYGKNFGVSVVPFRPPMAFGAPLGRH